MICQGADDGLYGDVRNWYTEDVKSDTAPRTFKGACRCGVSVGTANDSIGRYCELQSSACFQCPQIKFLRVLLFLS